MVGPEQFVVRSIQDFHGGQIQQCRPFLALRSDGAPRSLKVWELTDMLSGVRVLFND